MSGLLALGAVALTACEEPSRPSDGPGAPLQTGTDFRRVSTIAFVTTRDNPALTPALLASEIYLMDARGDNLRRLTQNEDGDGFPALSPDGKKLVFDSNRLRAHGEPLNTSDLFLMDPDGSNQVWLTRGSSATWSPDGRSIAFHASASGTGQPIRADPGSATLDSDIFVANVDELLEGVAQPRNITSSTEWIEDDPDWSSDGKLVFTRHLVNDTSHQNPRSAEIYVMNPGDTAVRLTHNNEEERAPSWSADGSRIVYSCRRGGPDFEICLMNADGTGQQQLTDNANAVPDLTPTFSPEFSPDSQRIVFHTGAAGRFQLWVLNPDADGRWVQQQLTSSPGINLLANWGELRVRE